LIPLKVISPVFALIMAVIAVANEIQYPLHSPKFWDTAMSYLIFATPLTIFVVLFIWNPFGDENKRAKSRAVILLSDESEGEIKKF